MSVVRYFSFGDSPSYPVCALTLAAAGPMKPTVDDANRERVFRSLGVTPSSVLAVKQIHSRIVHIADSPNSVRGFPEGDGILTRNAELVPSVTVADCMPIWLFDPETAVFGVLHSGWKGTGIVRSAIELAFDEWGAEARNFRVILGPHIRSCCYTVDAERAEYFTRSFGPSCVTLDREREAEGSQWPYRLSLAEANGLRCCALGILPDHITDVGECTACKQIYGSNRREGSDKFTHMAAFIRAGGQARY